MGSEDTNDGIITKWNTIRQLVGLSTSQQGESGEFISGEDPPTNALKVDFTSKSQGS